MNDNVKNFLKEVEANEELRAKIEALGDVDDAVGQTLAIAAEYGCPLTEEDLDTITEEDFKEGEDAELSLDDLDSAAGGITVRDYINELNWKQHELGRLAERLIGRQRANEFKRQHGL